MALSKQQNGYSIFWQIVFLLVTSIQLFGCEKPLDNPEQADRIYNDLSNDQKAAKALADTQMHKVEDLNKDIESTKIGDNSIKAKFRMKYEAEHTLEMMRQREQFLALEALKRKEYVLNAYPKYFKDKKAWPDMDEWKNYEASKRLQQANHNWDKRVPKLGKHIKEYADYAAATYGGGGGAGKEGGEGQKKPVGEGAQPGPEGSKTGETGEKTSVEGKPE